MTSAKAYGFDPHESEPSLAAPHGETPVARPAFGRSMTFLVLLSIPLWAVIIGAGYAVYRLFT